MAPTAASGRIYFAVSTISKTYHIVGGQESRFMEGYGWRYISDWLSRTCFISTRAKANGVMQEFHHPKDIVGVARVTKTNITWANAAY